MVKDIALKFLSATSAPITMTLGSRPQTKNFDVKVFRSLLLLYLWMDLVYTWYGNTGLKFLAASALMTLTLGSRSQTLNSYVKFLFLIF